MPAVEALAFHYASASIADAKSFGGVMLALSATTAVTVIFDEKLEAGDCPILSCGAGLSAATFKLATSGALGSRKVSLVKTDAALTMRVVASGTIIVIR